MALLCFAPSASSLMCFHQPPNTTCVCAGRWGDAPLRWFELMLFLDMNKDVKVLNISYYHDKVSALASQRFIAGGLPAVHPSYRPCLADPVGHPIGVALFPDPKWKRSHNPKPSAPHGLMPQSLDSAWP